MCPPVLSAGEQTAVGRAVSPGIAGALHAAHICRGGSRSAADVREWVPVAAPGLGHTLLNVTRAFRYTQLLFYCSKGREILSD